MAMARMVAKCPHCATGLSRNSKLQRNAAGEVVARQYQCHDCKRWWSEANWQQPDLVPNDRQLIPLGAVPQFPGVGDQERFVRQCFALYPRWDKSKIGRVLGKSREAVRQVLIGRMLARVAPDLRRYTRESMAALAGQQVAAVEGAPEPPPVLNCYGCLHWLTPAGGRARCGMGFPDADGDPLFANLCAVFQEGAGEGPLA